MRSAKSQQNIIIDLQDLLSGWKEILAAIPVKKKKESVAVLTFCTKFASLAGILEHDLNELEKLDTVFEVEVISVIKRLENVLETETKYIIFPELPQFIILFGIKGQIEELRKKHEITE